MAQWLEQIPIKENWQSVYHTSSGKKKPYADQSKMLRLR